MTRPLRWLCYALLALGLAVAIYSAALRVRADAQSDQVLVLVDWRELNGLTEDRSLVTEAGQERESGEEDGSQRQVARDLITDRRQHNLPWELLQQLPGAQLAYGEETVGDLLMQGIIEPAQQTTTGPVFQIRDQRYESDIISGARRHGYLYQNVYAGRDSTTLIQFPAHGHEGVNGLPLAWREDVIATAESRQVPLLLRPAGTEYVDEDGLFETLGFAAQQPLTLFQGTQVLGYPHELTTVATTLQKNNQLFGWVEFDDQDGGAQLASLMAPDVARVHSITADEMEKYTVDRAVARYELALKERGIRVLFLRPFSRVGLNKIENATELGYRQEVRELNLQYFGAIAKMLKDNGFKLGTPRRFTNPPNWLVPVRQVTTTLAATAGLLLLISLLVPRLTSRWVLILLAVGTLAAVATLALGNLYTLVLLATGIIFPMLGFWLALSLYQRACAANPADSFARLGWALLGLVVATAYSTAGGLLIHGGMWSARALLHIDQFRGVTIALAVPVLLVAAYCWQAESLQDTWDSARRELASFWQRFTLLWYAPIRYGDVAVILLVVGAMGVMLLRSGNEGPVGVLGAEGSLRSFLESALAVRPRTKELLGHPLLVLFLVTLPWHSRAGLLFALAGIVGQVSVLNTFEHLHTPLLITLQRVGIGLLLGLLAGAVLGLIALGLRKLWSSGERRVQSLAERAEAS